MSKIGLKKRSRGYWVCLDKTILGTVERTFTGIWKAESLHETIYRPTRAACVRDLIDGCVRKGQLKRL